MTKIKLCGIKRHCDIDYVNELMPDYIGFVFVPNTKRYIDFDTAKNLRSRLNDGIDPVGVFIDETHENIENLVRQDIISAVQLHGGEDNEYIEKLRRRVNCPIIKAFRIRSEKDIAEAKNSAADYILLDSGAGTGKIFNHALIGTIGRDFFLAGGLDAENVCGAISEYHPFAVDASSSLETDGVKDKKKMAAFVKAVRYGKDEKK